MTKARWRPRGKVKCLSSKYEIHACKSLCAPVFSCGLLGAQELALHKRHGLIAPGSMQASEDVRKKLLYHALRPSLEADEVTADAREQYLNCGGTDLSLAALRGDQELVEVLLASGAKDVPNLLGVTAVYEASMRGFAEIVRLLAVSRADLNARCSDGSTALIQAAYVASQDEQQRATCAVVVSVLRELGADLTLRDIWGKTAADYCRRVPELEAAIGSEVFVTCPYDDCKRVYRVRRVDYRCRIVRCGCALYQGREYQLPPHGSRADVRSWLQDSWGWPDWPGQVLGCGRPFRFPDESGLGLFLTWSEEVTGSAHPNTVDVEGDYSIASRDL